MSTCALSIPIRKGHNGPSPLDPWYFSVTEVALPPYSNSAMSQRRRSQQNASFDERLADEKFLS
jgi:hypothetical protein